MNQRQITETERRRIIAEIDRANHRPAHVLQGVLGIRGIARDYVFPVYIDPTGMQRQLSPDTLMTLTRTVMTYHRILGEMNAEQALAALTPAHAAMCRANPDLAAIPVFGLRQTCDVLSGAASGFNTDDIKSYLTGNYFYIVRRNPEWRGLQQKVLGFLPEDASLGWVPCKKTLKAIIKAFESKRAPAQTKQPKKKH